MPAENLSEDNTTRENVKISAEKRRDRTWLVGMFSPFFTDGSPEQQT
jgi:hypothetical protein